MPTSDASAKVLYRGFIIDVRVTKKSSGKKMARTEVRNHVPELKPKYAKHTEERKTVQTENGELECIDVMRTMKWSERNRLKVTKRFDPTRSESGGVLSFLSNLLSNKSEKPATSTLVREAVSDTQDRIDSFIEDHSLVEIEKDEVMHGLEQSLAEPLDGVDIQEATLNTETEYDGVRPDPEEVVVAKE